MAINLKIDNKAVEAQPGETVLQVALRNGIDIPHFCYHPCLSIAGNCRMCMVKVAGLPKLMASCNLAVTPDMVVETDTEDVLRARRRVLQLILLNHPVDCGICDKAGECRLQDYQSAFGYGVSNSVDAKNPARKLVDLGPRISLDNERCILCSRCVRFTREISGTSALGIVERGAHAYVDVVHGSKEFDDPYSDNVVTICPVGALLSRDFMYKSRVWYLEPVPSVCTGCSRGCNTEVWRRKQQWEIRAMGTEKNRQAWRITPRENPDVNGPWLCNKGFDQYKQTTRERALVPMVDGAPVELAQALDRAAKLLVNAANPAAFVSAHASNEELDAFKAALGSRVRVYTREDHSPVPGEVIEDKILIKADKNPNSFGVAARFGTNPHTGASGHDLVIVWGDFTDYAALGGAKVVHLASYPQATGRPADVLIPISTTFERSGTFSNFEGRTSRFERVFDKPGTVSHAGDVFERLGA